MTTESASNGSRTTIDDRIANMDEEIALPRANGELLFEAPWEARAFGLAVALNEAGIYPWSDFSQGLARQIAHGESNSGGEHEGSYYEHWLATLEALVVANGLVTLDEIEETMQQQALLDDHDHDHNHDHDHDDDHHHNHHNGHHQEIDG